MQERKLQIEFNNRNEKGLQGFDIAIQLASKIKLRVYTFDEYQVPSLKALTLINETQN